jgi:hypothetical protein
LLKPEERTLKYKIGRIPNFVGVGLSAPIFRYAKAPQKIPLLSLALYICLSVQNVYAEEASSAAAGQAPAGQVPAAQTPAAELNSILEHDDFGKTENKIRLKFKKQPQSNINRDKPNLMPLLTILEKIAAHVLRVLVIAAVLAAIIFIIFKCRNIDFNFTVPKKIKIIKSGIADFGNESAEELLIRAKKSYNENNLKEAVALCYRAALLAFMLRGVEFPINATEYECLAIVKQKADIFRPQFKTLVNCRICAYSSATPQASSVNDSLDFCSSLIYGEVGEGANVK